MLKARLDPRAIRYPTIPSTLPFIHFPRLISTNTAIQRGIRKSRFEAGQVNGAHQRLENTTRHIWKDGGHYNDGSRTHGNSKHQDEPSFHERDSSRISTSQFRSAGRNLADRMVGETARTRKEPLLRRMDRKGTNQYGTRDSTHNGRIKEHVRENISWKRSERFGKAQSMTAGVEQNGSKRTRQSVHLSSSLADQLTSQEATHDHSPVYTAAPATSKSFPDASIESRFSGSHSGQDSKTPISIPYTTAASEFLYGTSVVIAALRTVRRKLYKLYIYQGRNRDDINQDKRIQRLADSRNLEVVKIDNDGLSLMDKMSRGRPHNVILIPSTVRP